MRRVIRQGIWKSIIEQNYLTGIGIWMLVAHVMLYYNNSAICNFSLKSAIAMQTGFV